MTPLVIQYRIYTEYVAPMLLAQYVDGATTFRAAGLYKGKSETSVIIEILGTADDAAKVRSLAEAIRKRYQQAEVWLTTQAISLTRFTIDGIREGLETVIPHGGLD